MAKNRREPNRTLMTVGALLMIGIIICGVWRSVVGFMTKGFWGGVAAMALWVLILFLYLLLFAKVSGVGKKPPKR